MEIGYFLSSEEHDAPKLLRQAQLAEDTGLGSVWISDHFHPWLDEQGQSPFVWSVIGAIGATTSLAVTTAVTCPTIRIHPAVIAQAAATSAQLVRGGFELGVGTGEALNEHILGDRWPITAERLDMLEEAIEVMRELWTGEEVTHRGRHYTVENARIYSLPDTPPPIVMSGFGPIATRRAAAIADGYVNTKPDKELVQLYRDKGGRGPVQGGLKVCWGPDEDECAKLAHHRWRTGGVPGELSQELRTPALFDQAAQLVTVDSVKESMPCGPDTEKIVAAIAEFAEAGFDRVYVNQIGDNQEEFFAMFRKDVLPSLAELDITPRART